VKTGRLMEKSLEPASGAMPYPPIGDYAIIGDCRTAGLLSRDGSLDWLCFPRFDSPSIFGALLDAQAGGRFRIRPAGQFWTDRHYLPDTNILETTFHAQSGTLVLRDLLPIAAEADKRSALVPDHEVLRELEVIHGDVQIEVLYEPRPEYGRLSTTLESRGALGLWCAGRGGALILCSALPLEVEHDRRSARGAARLRAGERVHISLSYAEEAPAIIPLLGEAAHAQIGRSMRWWQDWAARCTYRGPYREAVVRSALALKLMAYAPSGAVVAAPTTSLPEQLGGVRNWDYRFCWLRDASFTVRALYALGYREEADAFLSWMLHATRLTWPELQVVYDVFGEAYLPEHELPHLRGYASSAPVRVGNDAHGQLQLDVYGEVLDAVSRFARQGGRFDRDTVRLLDGIGHTVCKRWREPDEGIWEGRSGRFHHTHSKALCWVALDRLIQLHDAGQIRICKGEFQDQRDAIRAQIEARGYNPQLGSYTRTLDGDELDAGLLTLPLYGYIAATHPRMRATSSRILERLGRDGLIARYETRQTDDGLPPGEGAFGICSFWAVESQALGGESEAAARAFEKLLTYANDVGLLAEEIDPESGAALGNFPQALTHIGLINAALTLAQVNEGRLLASPQPSASDSKTKDRS
jgi:GH15 family glucan-1,4-alpha-glucosidase